MEKRDLIIIGGGPAGLTVGIYGVRAELKTLIIESGVPGGQIAEAGVVENYLGFPDGILGMELVEKMQKQAEKAGVEFHTMVKVTGIEKKDGITVKTSNEDYKAKAVIIATGLRHRKLRVKGEEEFKGRGVSYCTTCDGPLFKGKKVVVVGSGTPTVFSAVYLSEIADEVKMIVKGKRVRATEKIMETRLKESNVEILYNSKVEEIVGDSLVKGIKVLNLKSGKTFELETDGVFVEAGKAPNTEFLKGSGILLSEKGYIKVDEEQRTNIPGIYAAGDVTIHKVKQLGMAVSQGTVAALTAYNDIKGKKI